MASTKRTKTAAKAEPKKSATKPARTTTKSAPVKAAASKKPEKPAEKPSKVRAVAPKARAATASGAPTPPAPAPVPPAPTPTPPPAPVIAAPARPSARTPDELLEVGRAVLGIKDYRPGQREAIEHLLAGKDVIAVMPTGSGKSLLYQLPSLILPGLTVVVSPLIALIKDQVDKMVAKGVAVVRIDSTLTVRQRREMDALARAPGGKLLLTTPERMADPEFRAFLRECSSDVGVSRFVVDEAHCVSQWGHDFRPAYLSLRKALEDVGRPPVLATTATAPPHVREDIKHQLGIADAEIVTTTFDRPNLHYEVITFPGEDDKIKTLVTLLKKLPRPGIVYCATVKKVEELYESLGRHGIPVSKYHGRMNKSERDSEQERFMESTDLVMLATNAFGLGVDKKNIRNVLHYHVPGSLEAYAQEAGRGGRDGKPSRCVLLFSPDDVAIQEYFLSGTYPTRRQVKAVYEALEAYVDAARGPMRDDTPINVSNIALGSGVGQQRTRTVLSLLKDEGFIVERDGGIFDIADPPLPEEHLNDKARQYESRRIMDRKRLDSLLAYVKAPGCRNVEILDYLGEPDAPKCGRCDNCLRSREQAIAAANEATRLGFSVTRVLDEEGTGEQKPRKLMRHRVVRIDQPPADAAATAAPGGAPGAAPTNGVSARPAPGPMVRTRTPAPAPTPPPAPAPAVRRRASAEEEARLKAERAAAEAEEAARKAAAEKAAADKAAADKAQAEKAASLDAGGLARDERQQQAGEDEEFDDDEEDDDLDDDDDDDLDDDDDDDDDDEDGDEDEVDDEDDDDLDDEDDDDLDDDEDDDDDDDDDDEDDDDYEVIDRTAAELAEEGVEVDGEITVLARKRQPKVPKPRTPRPDLTPDQSAAAEARRRRRRRRRKRRAMLPPKSAFTTPVLSTTAPGGDSSLPGSARARQGGGGPVIEYVRGPMRINMAPVASAAPSDNSGRGGGGKRRHRERWVGPGGGGGGGGGAGDSRGARPLSAAERRAERRAERLEKKRRRRRRRKRNLGMGLPADGAPVSFFSPVGGQRPQLPGGGGPNGGPPRENGQNGGPPGNGAPPQVVLGPDGQPLPRKRRRRRRRGRGGRGRPDFRPGAPGGPAQLEGGAPPPPALPPPRDEGGTES